MNTTPAPATPPVPPPRRAPHGAAPSGAHPNHRRHVLGDVLHAVRVFAGAALSVAVLGDTGERDDRERPGNGTPAGSRTAGTGSGPGTAGATAVPGTAGATALPGSAASGAVVSGDAGTGAA
ncbi:hypothetical protein [Streptomyces zingiberis]|uniref:Uncharacterized protein n=1 Tax=Streptomyces zingiberis TaxID=2053010 RepID=A0ABX1BZ92_9ACTN|nr:hypothetical protein [Streptomyces zingiberis]NJP99973.1 hypothetical protein [Streptomyces zingiberis]